MSRRFKIGLIIASIVGVSLGSLVVVMTDNQDLYYAFAGLCVVLGFVGLRMTAKISMAKFLRGYLAMIPILLAILISYIFDNSWAGWAIIILMAVGTTLVVADIWRGIRRFKKQSDP